MNSYSLLTNNAIILFFDGIIRINDDIHVICDTFGMLRDKNVIFNDKRQIELEFLQHWSVEKANGACVLFHTPALKKRLTFQPQRITINEYCCLNND